MMGDITAAVIRGQLAHIDEVIAAKKAVYERYRERLDDGLAYLIPAGEKTEPNYRMTVMTCESGIVLPGSILMMEEEQEKVIEIVLACYNRADMDRTAWV